MQAVPRALSTAPGRFPANPTLRMLVVLPALLHAAGQGYGRPMQRLSIVLAAGLTAAGFVAGCSNLTAPSGDDPHDLPQVQNPGDVSRPRLAIPGQPAGSAEPEMPRLVRPPLPMHS